MLFFLLFLVFFFSGCCVCVVQYVHGSSFDGHTDGGDELAIWVVIGFGIVHSTNLVTNVNLLAWECVKIISIDRKHPPQVCRPQCAVKWEFIADPFRGDSVTPAVITDIIKQSQVFHKQTRCNTEKKPPNHKQIEPLSSQAWQLPQPNTKFSTNLELNQYYVEFTPFHIQFLWSHLQINYRVVDTLVFVFAFFAFVVHVNSVANQMTFKCFYFLICRKQNVNSFMFWIRIWSGNHYFH